MKKKLLIIAILLLAFSSHSQQGTSSPYSFHGLGTMKFKGLIENRSMGGLGMYSDSIQISLKNPASYAGNNLMSFDNEARLVRFTVGGGQYATNYSSSSSDGGKSKNTTFDYLALNMPLGKFGVAFGLLPYTSVGYDLIQYNENESLSDRFRGQGGINKVFLGLGYQIFKQLSIGIDAQYNFGSITSSSVAYGYNSEEEPIQYQSRETNQSDLSGVNFNFGMLYNAPISENNFVMASWTYTLESDLTSNNQRDISTIITDFSSGQEYNVNSIDVDLSALGLAQTTLSMPSKAAAGIGIGAQRKWFVGLEYTLTNTSKFSNPLYAIDNVIYEDKTEYALGGFYVPNFSSYNKYWQRVVYRAGIRYGKSGLNINNESIDDFGISFGLGLPVGSMFSKANIGFEYGQRGTTRANLVQENYFNIMFSLSLNDRWFEKRKFN